MSRVNLEAFEQLHRVVSATPNKCLDMYSWGRRTFGFLPVRGCAMTHAGRDHYFKSRGMVVNLSGPVYRGFCNGRALALFFEAEPDVISAVFFNGGDKSSVCKAISDIIENERNIRAKEASATSDVFSAAVAVPWRAGVEAIDLVPTSTPVLEDA